MKLLLIYPSARACVRSFFLQTEGEGIGAKPPLGLLYIASHVRAHSAHEVTILDLQARPLADADFDARVRAIAPDVVGFTCWTDFWYETARLAARVKRLLPAVHVCMGGPHVGVFPAETLARPEVDSVVLGDGESPMLRLLDHLATGAPLPGEGLYLSPPAQWVFHIEKDLDRLPVPDRTLLPLDDYTSVLSRHARITTMITSRGCPHRCVYCKLNFQKTVCASAGHVLDELARIQQLGIREVEIYDDTFTWSKERLRAICEGIVARGITLDWAVRDRVNAVTEENLRLMRQAGCNRIHLGIESGSPAVLERIKKGITLEQARHAVTAAHRAGMKVLAYYMIGLPGEREADVAATIDLACSLPSDYAEFNICIPYAGTAMYQAALAEGVIGHDYWLAYARDPAPDFQVPAVYEEHLDIARMVALRDQATRRFYMRPRVLLREVLACRSPAEFRKKARMGWTLLKHCLPARHRGRP